MFEIKVVNSIELELVLMRQRGMTQIIFIKQRMEVLGRSSAPGLGVQCLHIYFGSQSTNWLICI